MKSITLVSNSLLLVPSLVTASSSSISKSSISPFFDSSQDRTKLKRVFSPNETKERVLKNFEAETADASYISKSYGPNKNPSENNNSDPLDGWGKKVGKDALRGKNMNRVNRILSDSVENVKPFESRQGGRGTRDLKFLMVS